MLGTCQKVSAQEIMEKRENISITINNGDTTVNGKKFKDISEKERVGLRKNFDNLHTERNRITMGTPHIYKRVYMEKKGDSLFVDSLKTTMFSYNFSGEPSMLRINGDSIRILKDHNIFLDRNGSRNEIFLERKLDDNIDWQMVHPRRGPGMPNPGINRNVEELRTKRPNSSNFDYSTTDKDGFTTNTHIEMMEPNKMDLKNSLMMENASISTLKVENLVFYPNFSSGKMALSFNTDVKGTLEVKLTANNGDVVFAEKKALTGDTYNKQFPLSKNGIYFLQITQGNKTFIRKVIKN